jgi:D-aspartate ligase
MKISDTTTPVVALVCHHHVGLGIMRSLGRLGIATYGVESDSFSPALASRYCRGKFTLDLHRTAPEKSIASLMKIGARIGRRSLLIPTSDAAVMLVADHACTLSEWFIFPERDAHLIHKLCDKREMYRLARQCGVATPETAYPQSRAEAEDFCRVAQFPVLIKPMLNRVPALHPTMKPWRMTLVHSREELLQRYDAFETPSAPNVMLQEYIPGGDEMTWTFNGYFDRDGVCRVAFTGRKLRNFPAYFGQASLAACVDNDVVKQTSIDFMTAIGYRGPLDLGYRYDARDGRYKINDVNPRLGAMFRVFVAENGMDVVRAMYQDLTGQPVGSAHNPHGRKWIVEDVDFLAALRYWRDGRLTVGEWVRSLKSISERTLFCGDDLRPLGAACLMDVRRALSQWRERRQNQREREYEVAGASVASAQLSRAEAADGSSVTVSSKQGEGGRIGAGELSSRSVSAETR